MRPKIKRKIKRLFLLFTATFLIVAALLNIRSFTAPIRFLTNTFGGASAAAILPQRITLTRQGDTPTYTREYVTAQNRTEAIEQATAATQQTTQNGNIEVIPEDETVLAAATADEGRYAGGRIRSHTITNAGANASYGDIFVRNNTDIRINLRREMEAPPTLQLNANADGPQVLLIHTHGTEGFFPEVAEVARPNWRARTTNRARNIVAAGVVVKQELERAGIRTVHSTTLHDDVSFSAAYSHSRQTIKKYLERYPTIQVVLDIHRDAIGGRNPVRPIVSINGQTAAQVMVVVGAETGEVRSHPNWRQNFRFGLRLQQDLEQTFPNFARPLFLNAQRYNQDLGPHILLVEIGSHANVLPEVLYSSKLFAQVFAQHLQG